MKYIQKGKEPTSLTAKRNTEGAKYECAETTWQQQLLDDQGYLCAYCMGRISLALNEKWEPKIGIEHYLSRKLNPELELIWKNMLGVCNGTFSSDPHCDKAKGAVALNILNPSILQKSEQLIKYSIFGDILPDTPNQGLEQKIIDDLNSILNLNDEKLRNARKDVIDRAKDILKKKHPTGPWTNKDIDKEISHWQSKTKRGGYKVYCQAAIWYLKSLKK